MRAKLHEAALAHKITVDSAGTHRYHIGKAPDLRTQTAALTRGYDLSAQRARQVSRFDFARFDHILAMDRGHLRLLREACPPMHQHKITMFLDNDVPDPYYGGEDGFEDVLDMIEQGVKTWLTKLSAD